MSKQTSKTLLPCPFCGGKAGIHRSHDADGMLWVGVRCQGCEAASTQYWCSPGNDCPIFYECVRNSWNRRASVEPEPPTAPTSEEQLRATAQQMLNDGYSHMLVDPLDILRLTRQSGGKQS